MNQPAVVSIDFETFYDARYSITKMSTWNYVFDDRFDAYLVSIKFPGRDTIVCHPRDFDWESINGHLWVMHNAGFDGLVIKRLQQDGIIAKHIEPFRYFDTADLAVWVHMADRSLKACAKYLLGKEVSKEVRTKMVGKLPKDLTTTELEDLYAYAGTDADLALEMYETFHERWPEKEQVLSNLNLQARWRGVPADYDAAVQKEEEFKTRLWELTNLLPWMERGEKPMSQKAAREQGRIDGIEMPPCFDAREPAFLKWEEKYGEPTPENGMKNLPWVKARRERSRVNTFMKKIANFQVNIREDEFMPYEMKYMGAGITGRFSGGGDTGQKYNLLNMTRGEVLMVTDEDGSIIEGSGVDQRGMIKAPKGFVIGVQDYSQIEARLLLWRAGDKVMLEKIRTTGMSIYEVYARDKFGWSKEGDLKKAGKTDPEADRIYRTSKAVVLGAGYFCGGARFKDAAWQFAQLKLSEAESHQAIAEFRAANPKIVAYWKEHQRWLLMSASMKDDTHEILLPSGRRLVYHKPRAIGKDDYGRPIIRANFGMGGLNKKLHGGLLTENEMQAIGRDILCEAWVELAKAKIPVLFTLYDEFVYLLPENEAEDMMKEAERIITTSSPWAEGCPLAVTSDINDTYR